MVIMPVLNACCCCCSLRTGGTILAWMGMVCNAFNIALTVVALIYEDNLFKRITGPGLHIGLVCLVVSAVIDLVTYILLLIGSAMGNRYVILPWLVARMTTIIFTVFIVIGGGIILICIPSHEPDNEQRPYAVYGALVLILGIPACALQIYWWVCVLSLFQELREAETSVGAIFIPPPYSLKENPPSYYNPQPLEKLEHI